MIAVLRGMGNALTARAQALDSLFQPPCNTFLWAILPKGEKWKTDALAHQFSPFRLYHTTQEENEVLKYQRSYMFPRTMSTLEESIVRNNASGSYGVLVLRTEALSRK